MKIGLFGGTFNPVHNGHLIIAEAAREHFLLDSIVFVPTRRPPHKELLMSISDEKRLSMLIEAIIGNPFFSVSDFEYQSDEETFACDTIMYFKEQYPESTFFYLIGDDHLSRLHSWKNIETLQHEVTFIVAARQNTNNTDTCQYGVQQFSSPLIEISSSAIREKCRKGESIRYLVPESTHKTITEEGLYREGKKST